MTPETIALLKRAFQDSRAQVRVAEFGRITAIGTEPGTPTVDIEFVLTDPVDTFEGERGNETLPPIQGVPVMFPKCGPVSITWPLVIGGIVLVVFHARDFDAWFTTGNVPSDCLDTRPHTLDSAVAFPVGFSMGQGPEVSPTAGTLTVNATQMLVGNITASLKVALASVVDSHIESIRNTFNTHVHPATGGATGVPATLIPLAFSPTGSNVLKTSG